MTIQNILTQKRLGIIYKVGIFLILLLPLISAPPYFHPADWGKSISFRIIFSIMLFLFFWEMFLYPDKKRGVITTLKSSKIVWFLGAIIAIFSLATIFSLDPNFSFWGSPYRGDGSFNFILYIIFGIFAFLNLKNIDWKRFWDFNFIVGILISFVGISQSMKLFKGFLVSYDQASATMGSSVLLGLYLILLSFMALSFALSTKGKKSIFYYASLFIFLITINFAASRAAFLGIGMGLLFFVFFYKNRNNNEEKKLNKIVWIKIAVAVLLIVLISTIFLIKNNTSILSKLSSNRIGSALYRITLTVQTMSNTKSLIPDTRWTAWQIGLNALKDRPLLGYGPENFAIAFDSHFDPTLTKFGKLYWWDRAHNFAVEMAVTAGIPAIAIFISFIIFVFYKLQNLKKQNPENYTILHGIQTTIIAYLTANLLGMDGFSTFMLFYFLIGYSCFLIYKNNENTTERITRVEEKSFIKYIFLISVLPLFYFIWACNLYPLILNKDINWADYYLQKNELQKSIDKMDIVVSSNSIINNYSILKYLNITNVIDGVSGGNKEQKLIITKKSVELLRKAVVMRPYYTRSWLFLGNHLFNLAQMDKSLSTEDANKFKESAMEAFDKAQQLCPKCESIYTSLIKTHINQKNYKSAEESANSCIQTFPDSWDCWWLRAIIKVASNDLKGAKEYLKIAQEKGYPIYDASAQEELLNAYVAIKDKNSSTEYYKDLKAIYEKLIEYGPNNFQWRASLAFVYKNLGEYAKAKEQALIMLKLKPELKTSVDAFIQTLPPVYR